MNWSSMLFQAAAFFFLNFNLLLCVLWDNTQSCICCKLTKNTKRAPPPPGKQNYPLDPPGKIFWLIHTCYEYLKLVIRHFYILSAVLCMLLICFTVHVTGFFYVSFHTKVSPCIYIYKFSRQILSNCFKVPCTMNIIMVYHCNGLWFNHFMSTYYMYNAL